MQIPYRKLLSINTIILNNFIQIQLLLPALAIVPFPSAFASNMAPDVNTGYNNLKYAMEYKTNLRRREMNNTIRIYTEDKH